LNNLYLVFLIILLILIFIISFKTGENIYYLTHTNLNEESTNTYTGVAGWGFEVRIEY
jgi:hypothetical protein